MALLNTLTKGNFAQHRLITGAPAAADSTDLSLIDRKAVCRTDGRENVNVYLKFTGGAGPTADVIPLLYDADSDTFVARPKVSALANGTLFVVDTYDLPLYVRIDAVAGNPTAIEVRVAPAKISFND